MAVPLESRVAIVTGSSRGIGRAIAAHLASLGAKLVINYVTNSTQADHLVSEINSNSTAARAIAVQADVSDEFGAKTLFDRAEEAFGSPVHIFINSAGVIDSKYPTISSTSVQVFDQTFRVNARGAFLCCREAANRIVRGGGGRIIMITTSLVASLLPNFGAYAASKAAVEAMTKTLARELNGTKITANCVAPGAIATDLFFEGKSEEDIEQAAAMNPMGRIGETKDVASLVGFLCTDAGEWVNGQVIRVNGGSA